MAECEKGYMKLQGRFSGVIVEWKDGEVICDKKTKKKIEDYAKLVIDGKAILNIANMYFGSNAPLADKLTAYATICGAVEDMTLIGGGPIKRGDSTWYFGYPCEKEDDEPIKLDPTIY